MDSESTRPGTKLPPNHRCDSGYEFHLLGLTLIECQVEDTVQASSLLTLLTPAKKVYCHLSCVSNIHLFGDQNIIMFEKCYIKFF